MVTRTPAAGCHRSLYQCLKQRRVHQRPAQGNEDQHPPQPQPGGHRPLQPQQHQSHQQAGPCRPQLPDAHAQQHGGKNARRKGQRYGG